jgi:Holliday junction resolvase-like predicted endonuclease
MTDKQLKVAREGIKGEVEAENWLREHDFHITESHAGKAHAGHYDIKAKKGKDKWIIEVKTGESPQIRVANFRKMLQEKGFNKIGLALVTEGEVHLLEYKKMRLAGYKAARTKGPKVRKEAAKKAWETRKHIN